MILIDIYKETLWNGAWLHLEIIIVVYTRSIAVTDAPSRPSSASIHASAILGVA